MDKSLQEIIKRLSRQQDKACLEEAEKLLETYLEKYPKDTDGWLRLALLVLSVPLVDFYKSINCIHQVLSYDANNADAVLLLTYVYHTSLGGVDENLFNRLDRLTLEDNSYRSMIEYVKSWRYWRTGEPPYEELLLRSVQIYGCHVYNYLDLARYYVKNGQMEQGKYLARIGLSNIVAVYSEDIEIADGTSLKELFNEQIKGVHVPDWVVDSIKKEFDI